MPLKPESQERRVNAPPRLSTFVHTNVLLAILCDRKKTLRQRDPLQPIAADIMIQIKLTILCDREKTLRQRDPLQPIAAGIMIQIKLN